MVLKYCVRRAVRIRLNQILRLIDYLLLYFSLISQYYQSFLFHQPRVNDARGRVPFHRDLAHRAHARVHVHD